MPDEVVLEATAEAPDLAADEAERFVGVCHLAAVAVNVIASKLGCPPVRVEAIATHAFVETVEATVQATEKSRPEQQPYTIDRISGYVAAKTMALVPDYSEARVVVNGFTCAEAGDWGRAMLIGLVAHEFAHCTFGRLRAAAARSNEPIVGTPAYYARHIAAEALEEYRADQVSDIVLGSLATTGEGDDRRKLRLGDLHLEGHRAGMREVLDRDVWPALPRLVRAYQVRSVPLGDMWNRVVEITEQLLVALAHAEAEAASVDQSGPLSAECSDHAAVELLLPMWETFVEHLDENPIGHHLADFESAEATELQKCEQAIFDFWEQLGLTFGEPDPSGGFALHVGSPAREDEWDG